MSYEAMPGNIRDRQTLVLFRRKIRRRFGRARRTRIMDRCIPTELTRALLRRMRHRRSSRVGTSKGRIPTLEKHRVGRPWHPLGDGDGDNGGSGCWTHAGPVRLGWDASENAPPLITGSRGLEAEAAAAAADQSSVGTPYLVPWGERWKWSGPSRDP